MSVSLLSHESIAAVLMKNLVSIYLAQMDIFKPTDCCKILQLSINEEFKEYVLVKK